MTDSSFKWQRLIPQWYYIPTKKYGQNTIEIAFVKLKHLKKGLIFIDLTGFLMVRRLLVQTEIFHHL